MSRISQAFRSFFSILFSGVLPADIAQAFGYSKVIPIKTTPAPPPKPQGGPNDGAVQILSVLQRDARLVDFLMEDISSYSDEQVGAAVRDVQLQARQTLERYLKLAPVIDGVEGDFTKTDGIPDAALKLVGKVPPSGKAPGGVLRHKGWKAEKVDLPALPPGNILAPAEIEVE
ncbi:MAG TPA: DUF2760 domain-containing protein [Bryobacteraceae bacterium]|nr:DUF2760 domain-containing protein [Bryobacteraceae bacterium]